MSGKIFAFQLARPAESTEPMSREYDPQTQTIVWQGGTPARAIGKSYCTPLVEAGWENCETPNYGLSCKTSGAVCPPVGYQCEHAD
jgi:hypothetical protein